MRASTDCIDVVPCDILSIALWRIATAVTPSDSERRHRRGVIRHGTVKLDLELDVNMGAISISILGHMSPQKKVSLPSSIMSLPIVQWRLAWGSGARPGADAISAPSRCICIPVGEAQHRCEVQ